jgi:aryl-alcohol dehydrogenase-like predicted oxidoreductase
MQYRVHRGEKLSEIDLGCYALSGAYGQRDPESLVGLLRQAHDWGITFFDTAAIYGPAEEVLGRAVAPFFVGSEEETLSKFREIRDQIDERIEGGIAELCAPA